MGRDSRGRRHARISGGGGERGGGLESCLPVDCKKGTTLPGALSPSLARARYPGNSCTPRTDHLDHQQIIYRSSATVDPVPAVLRCCAGSVYDTWSTIQETCARSCRSYVFHTATGAIDRTDRLWKVYHLVGIGDLCDL